MKEKKSGSSTSSRGIDMKHNLEEDWNRVVDVWHKWRANHWSPAMALFAGITELRKLDRGIDYPLRRLLDSEKYGWYVRTYGGPTGSYPRYPFRWGNRIWISIRVKVKEFREKEEEEGFI